LVNAVKEEIALYYFSHMDHTSIYAICGQNVELLNVETGGGCNYHCAFKVKAGATRAHKMRPL
jgi:hypothetical protein